MAKSLTCNNPLDFHIKAQDLNEGIKDNKLLTTDLTFTKKDGRILRWIKILLSIFPGDRFEKTRIYNVAAVIEKFCKDHHDWVSQKDKQHFITVIDFLEKTSNKSKNQQRKTLNEKILKSTRETLASFHAAPINPSTPNTEPSTPNTPIPTTTIPSTTPTNPPTQSPNLPTTNDHVLKKMLEEMDLLFKDCRTYVGAAKQNREKSLKTVLPCLLDLTVEEPISVHHQNKLVALLDSNGEWLQNNFSKLPPPAIALIATACKFTIFGTQIWSESIIPSLAKSGSPSQLQAFLGTFHPFQGKNQLFYENSNKQIMQLAYHSTWIIQQ